MNLSAVKLVDQAGDYARLYDRVSVGGRFDETGSDGPIRLASDQELLDGLAEVSRLQRLAESERVKLAGEIARRSDTGDDTSLARRMGTTGAADLVAQVAGIRREEAGTIVRLGTAVRARESFTGDPLPAKRPHVAAAFAAGLLDRAVASAIVRAVQKSESGLTPGEVDDLERQLVETAQAGFTADRLIDYLKAVPEHAHPESAKPREDALVGMASVTKRTLDNGLTRWILDLDPLTAGFFEAAVEANTPKSTFRITEPGEPAPTEEERDRRPLKARRVDAVRLLARNVLKIDDGQVAGTAVTILVHMGLYEFTTGFGSATISGCDEAISAATARMLAAEARIIPVVLGGESQPLDLGTARRYFSEAQRLAMAARDPGGCSGPCCDAPMSWTTAAHVKPAGYGPTSIENGILLCWRCHTLHDVHGWQVHREEGRWWWTPPPWIDPTGTRRPGGAIAARPTSR